jgi:hypothetical protein
MNNLNNKNLLKYIMIFFFFFLNNKIFSELILEEASYYNYEISHTYQEFLNLIYEVETLTKSDIKSKSISEIFAYNSMIHNYFSRLLILYEESKKLNLSKFTYDSLDNIVARSYALQALTLSEYNKYTDEDLYELSVKYYFSSFNLLGLNKLPIIYRYITNGITFGFNKYNYLADLIDARADYLTMYSKVIFEINCIPEDLKDNFSYLQIVKLDSSDNELPYKNAVDEFNKQYTFYTNKTISILLPYGKYKFETYNDSLYNIFSIFYVPKSTQITFKIENINNKIIVYKKPNVIPISSKKIAKIKTIKRNDIIKEIKGINKKDIKLTCTCDSLRNEYKINNYKNIASIISLCLSRSNINLSKDNSNISSKTIKKSVNKLLNIIAESLLESLTNKNFYEEWNIWSTCWKLSKNIIRIVKYSIRSLMKICKLLYCIITQWLLVEYKYPTCEIHSGNVPNFHFVSISHLIPPAPPPITTPQT